MEQSNESNFAISLISRNKTTSVLCTTEFEQQNTEYCYIEPSEQVSIGIERKEAEIEIEMVFVHIARITGIVWMWCLYSPHCLTVECNTQCVRVSVG